MQLGSTMQEETSLAAYETAKALIEVKAVLVNIETPFKTTAGWATPVYIDMRKIISFPRLRKQLNYFAVAKIQQNIGYEKLDIIAGGETAGIPFAAWIAEELMLPMQYVRKKPKGFGRNARIEGDIRDNAKVLLVEDLATDGGSKKDFVKAIRESGQQCQDVFVYFFYDIFAVARDELKTLDINLHYLCTWRNVLEVARKHQYFSDRELKEIELFIFDPVAWSEKNGGVGH